MGLIMLAVWWITDKKWAGYLATIVIMSVEYYDSNGVISTGLLWRKYVMNYSVYKKEYYGEKYSYANSCVYSCVDYYKFCS